MSISSQHAPPVSASASGRTMKAIVRDRYGSADVLQVMDVEIPPGR